MWALICRTLGLTLTDALDRIDSEEFSWWIAQYNKDPWGEYRADFRNAINTYWNYIPNVDKADRKKVKFSSFFPDFLPKAKQTLASVSANMREFALKMKAKTVHKT